MKGIKCCGECAYYSMKKHKCTRGFTAGTESDRFFTDCDLPDAEIVKYAFWKFKEDRAIVDGKDWVCSNCRKAQRCKENYCPNCGARMVGVEDETD